MIKQLRVVYICLKSITIGNGTGRYSFEVDRSFSQKQLESASLTQRQINAYFQRKETF